MSDKAQPAFQAWKEADALARDAEAQLARAWEKYFQRSGGEPPGRDLVRQVARLRVIANGKLGAAMEEMGDATERPSGRARSDGHPA